MYRRRRILAAILVLIVVIALISLGLLIAGLFSSGDGSDTAGSASSPTRTTSAGPSSAATGAPTADTSATGSPTSGEESDDATSESTPSESTQSGSTQSGSTPVESAADEVTACGPGDLLVGADTDQKSYTTSDTAVFTLSVTNTSDTECTVNAGTSQMTYLVTSGQDRIYSSADCQVEASDQKLTLAAGETEKANLPWNLRRTESGCTEPAPKAKPGTYVLVTRLGDIASEKAVFRIR